MFVHKDRESISTLFIFVTVIALFMGFNLCDGLQCYKGNIQRDEKTLSSITCNGTDLASTATSTAAPPNATKGANYCLIFKPSTSTDGISEYWCDYTHVCAAVGLKSQADYRGHPGELYCCQGSLCNSKDRMEALSAAPKFSCYVGDSMKQVLQPCVSSMCVVKQDDAAKTVTYSCDNSNMCNGSAAKDSCYNDTSDTCCCHQDGCNKAVALSQLSYSPQHPLGPAPQHDSESRAKITATYAVGAGVMILLLVLLGIFITLGLRKCKQRQDAQYAYVYSELTADLADESDKDDDNLLVP